MGCGYDPTARKSLVLALGGLDIKRVGAFLGFLVLVDGGVAAYDTHLHP